jgi:hypothetical protein
MPPLFTRCPVVSVQDSALPSVKFTSFLSTASYRNCVCRVYGLVLSLLSCKQGILVVSMRLSAVKRSNII